MKGAFLLESWKNIVVCYDWHHMFTFNSSKLWFRQYKRQLNIYNVFSKRMSQLRDVHECRKSCSFFIRMTAKTLFTLSHWPRTNAKSICVLVITLSNRPIYRTTNWLLRSVWICVVNSSTVRTETQWVRSILCARFKYI